MSSNASTPRTAPLAASEFKQGFVKWFDKEKGYGFLTIDGINKDVFVHFSAIEGTGYRVLIKNEKVQARIETEPGDRYKAVEVRKIAAE